MLTLRWTLRWTLRFASVALVALVAACTTAQSSGTALPDSAGAPDGSAAETTHLDAASDPGGAADTQPSDTAVPGDGGAEAEAEAKPDSAASDTVAPADAIGDVSTDLVADGAAEVAPSDGAAETGVDVAAEVAAEVVDAKSEVAAADTAADTAADAISDAQDNGAKDTPVVETTPTDAGPAACKPGELKRCWVECPQTYAAGCISGQIPILIMGTHACAAGQWGGCEVKHQCGEFANGPCQNSSKAPQNYLCTDGIPMTGAHICTKPLGANCSLSYYINWPIYDCPMICNGPDDICATEGAERDCEARCGSATGPIVKGKQKCQSVCNGLHWNMCSTGEACK